MESQIDKIRLQSDVDKNNNHIVKNNEGDIFEVNSIPIKYSCLQKKSKYGSISHIGQEYVLNSYVCY